MQQRFLLHFLFPAVFNVLVIIKSKLKTVKNINNFDFLSTYSYHSPVISNTLRNPLNWY